MSKNHLETKLMILGMSSFVLMIGVLSLKLFVDKFDPIPWLTLVIGGAFGLAVAIIMNNHSQQVLLFINNAEKKRQLIANRTIVNNVEEIKQLSEFYFEIIRGKSLSVCDEKKLLNTFLPRFKTLITLTQNVLSLSGNSIPKNSFEEIEKCLRLLNDLILILEYGNNIKFKNNILKLSEYSQKLSGISAKISN